MVPKLERIQVKKLWNLKINSYTDWSIIQKNNLILVKTDIKNDANFSLQKKLYYKVLAEELLNQQISLITLQPQPYSGK